MSSATSSHPTSLATDNGSIASDWADRLVSGVRATAFWSAAILPILVIAALAVGTISQYPMLLAGALVLNAVCAIVGHNHTPRR